MRRHAPQAATTVEIPLKTIAIEITPEMLDAGARALWDGPGLVDSLAWIEAKQVQDIVKRVFVAMCGAQQACCAEAQNEAR